MDDQIAAAIREQAREGTLGCATAFRIARELDVTPLAVGRTADTLEARLVHCHARLVGYGEQKSIVKRADEVPADMEQAIQEGTILGRLPCAVAWTIAVRFEVPKRHVSDVAERLGVRIGQCQLGAF